MPKDRDFDEIDKQTYDIDEVTDTDIKINPSYYIHNGLLKAQNALIKDDYKAGFAQYRAVIEHLVILCRSAKLLADDFDTEVASFEKSAEFLKETDKIAQSMKIADFKLGLMMKEVFENKTITAPIKS